MVSVSKLPGLQQYPASVSPFDSLGRRFPGGGEGFSLPFHYRFFSRLADPFADSQEERRDQTKVHVRVQQRSGRKCITTVQGLADDLDLKRILKAFKKNFRFARNAAHLEKNTNK